MTNDTFGIQEIGSRLELDLSCCTLFNSPAGKRQRATGSYTGPNPAQFCSIEFEYARILNLCNKKISLILRQESILSINWASILTDYQVFRFVHLNRSLIKNSDYNFSWSNYWLLKTDNWTIKNSGIPQI